MNSKTKKLAVLALFTAIVAILQFLGSLIHFGPFSIQLVLVPIIVGAALYGISAGAWLGLVFGVVVLISGDAALFLAVSPVGTIITVLTKGVGAGVGAGLAYKLLKRINRYFAVCAAAVLGPVFNTGIFLIGCKLFFFETVAGWAEAAGFGGNVGTYMVVGLVGINFLVELLIDVVLCPIILRLINVGKKA